jgi:hypothetical protein
MLAWPSSFCALKGFRCPSDGLFVQALDAYNGSIIYISICLDEAGDRKQDDRKVRQ